ncbi:MAG: proline iminopeptidase-family hydrolase [Chloroflexi bacterium]|nr:proline iminopeptidase-family hydrolase [Chloroflexota bacterium]
MTSGYIDVEGGRVWYRIEGGGPGVPLLTLHGGPGIPHDYLEPLAVLGDERPVVFCDQLGAGKADRPDDSTLWTVERYVREVQRVRDVLELREVHILGQSWGTMLAVDYALSGAPGIRSLVLENPCLSVNRWAADADMLIAQLPPDVRDVIKKHRAAETYDDPEYQRALGTWYRRHMCRLEHWPELLTRTARAGNPAVYTAMWGPTDFVATGATREYERADDLGSLTMPVLYITGRHDTATPETTAFYAQQTPHAELAILEESSHSPHIEEPDAFNAVVRDFLHRVESR